MTEVSISQNFDDLFTKAEREPPSFCHLTITGSYSGPSTRLQSQSNSRGSPARKPTLVGICPGNPAVLEMKKRSAASRSHSMRDQTAHMREKYQTDRHNQRRLSTKSPLAVKGAGSRNNSLQGEEVEVTRQFLATHKKVINRGDSFKRKSHSSRKKHEETRAPPGIDERVKNEMPTEPLKIYRVAFLGSSQVGKTSIIDQFMSSEHTDVYETRDQAGAGDTDIDTRAVSVDVNGEESRLDLIEPAVEDLTVKEVTDDQNPDCFVIVYAVDDKESFTYADECLEWLTKNNSLSCKPCILVGNKSDLARSRVLESGSGLDLALRYGVKFTETSPGCGHHIDELLVGIVLQLRLYEAGGPKGNHRTIKETVKGIFSKVTGKDDDKKKQCRNLNV